MIDPIEPPQRKNPLLRTRLPASPPRPRSRTSHGFTRAAAEGRFMLQRCEACGAFAYPARETCPACLSADLVFVDAPRRGAFEICVDNFLAGSILRTKHAGFSRTAPRAGSVFTSRSPICAKGI